MRTTLRATNPTAIDFTLSITMTMGAWQRFSQLLNREDLKSVSPVWQLRRDINTLLEQASRVYHPPQDKPEEEN